MSTIKVDTITDEAGSGAPDFPNGMTGNGSSLTGLATSAQGALAATALQSSSSLAAANLTGALPAIDGSALTGVGASTTFGAVGTHIWGRPANSTDYNLNVTASSLFAITSNIDAYGGQGFYDNGWNQSPNQTSVSGTWRHLGGAGAANGKGMPGLWVRIS
jgi:hypothetical protein